MFQYLELKNLPVAATYGVCRPPVGLMYQVAHHDVAHILVAPADQRADVPDAEEVVNVDESLRDIGGEVGGQDAIWFALSALVLARGAAPVICTDGAGGGGRRCSGVHDSGTSLVSPQRSEEVGSFSWMFADERMARGGRLKNALRLQDSRPGQYEAANRQISIEVRLGSNRMVIPE